MIDDELDLREVLRYNLGAAGHEVTLAENGVEGLARARADLPDLVLLDLMLPGELTGTQVLERIRSDHGQTPKVLVVSALVNPATAVQLEAFGNVQTLAKPFKIKDLSSRIQTMLVP